MAKNPFITSGYEGPEYFCDRKEETERLFKYLDNGNNVVLMSPRRMGKTGLLYHCFQQAEVQNDYYTFIIDIYSTKNLSDLIETMGRTILNTLMTKGEKALGKFVQIVTSLRPTISFDAMGNPSWNVELGASSSQQITLQQIFDYIEQADKRCLVAIDEFQQIMNYPEKNIEAVLRTFIQRSKNCNFVFSGSEWHLLTEMFHSPTRPFYASTSTISLGSIDVEEYEKFAQYHFKDRGKILSDNVVSVIYNKFDGVTWYVQKVLNYLFADTEPGCSCDATMIEGAIQEIVNDNGVIYEDLLYQLTIRQKELLLAICKEGKAKAITGSSFLRKYRLASASTIQFTIKSLIEHQLVTQHLGVYEIYDKFFALWLNNKM